MRAKVRDYYINIIMVMPNENEFNREMARLKRARTNANLLYFINCHTIRIPSAASMTATPFKTVNSLF